MSLLARSVALPPRPSRTPRRGNPSRLLVLAGRLLVLGCVLSLAPLSAAGQSASVLLTGTVEDAASGAPLGGALVSLLDRGPRGLTGADGRFRIAGVPTGRQKLRVERFGYRTLETTVTVADPGAPIVLRMEVDAVALEGLTVTGDARVSQRGTVLDADTGEGVSWAEVTLTRDTQSRDASASADARGVFSLPAVSLGRYLLRVDRLGYESQYLPIEVAAPPEPIEVRLRVDPIALEGLTAMNSQRRTRLNAEAASTRAFAETRLRESRAPGMRHFLENDAGFDLTPCGNPPSGRNDCMEVRNRQVRPFVFIDEMPAMGLDHLDSYLPSELYSVEYILCFGGKPVLRAYTYAYMERFARRPSLLLGACFIPSG